MPTTLQTKFLEDSQGNKFAPVTTPNAVRWPNGDDLDDKLAEKQAIIDSLNKLSASNVSGLATVATSGSYNDLSNKPTTMGASGSSHAGGLVPDTPSTAGTTKFLREDGTWVVPPDHTYTIATTSEAGLMSADDKIKLGGIANGATKVTTDTVSGWGYTKNDGTITGITMNGVSKGTSGVVNLGTVITSHQDISGKVDNTTTINGHSLNSNITITKSDISLDNVTNDALVKRSEMGTALGVATLDNNGKVPSSQLPSYVDDVIEGYYYNSKFYEESAYTTEIAGEESKIYINISNNKSYRWSGSAYVEISSSDVTGIKVGSSGTTITPSGGIITIPSYTEGAQPHIAPTASEVKSALGIGSGTSKYLREDGTWLTPTFTAPVTSVAGKTGTVTLDKSDVGLDNVGNFKAVSTEANQGLTDTEKSNARSNIGAGTSSFSGSYNDLTDKPTIPDAQIQADWNLTTTTAKDYIKNKPTIPEAQVNADWNASSGVAQILNKPTIPSAANNGTFSVKTKVGNATAVTAADFTANQSTADDITFIQGDNITLTTNTTNRTITISSSIDLSVKEDKMSVSTISSGTTLSPALNSYYNFSYDVNTLTITLPSVSETTKILTIVLFLTTGESPNITYSAQNGVNVYKGETYNIEANSTYEINCLFNGVSWIVMSSKIIIT